MIRIGMAAVAAMLVLPAQAAQSAPGCVVARPAGGDLKAYAATYFPKASLADLDALVACLGDPDPAVRDDFAFTLWSGGLRGRHLAADQMRHVLARLSAIVAGPDDAAGFQKPFAALALSEVARADRVAPYLSEAELHALAGSGAAYLRGVTDYRGFVAGEGWRHGVAHGATS